METDNLEFKESWIDDILKTICAFANTSGGKLIIGINDKGKKELLEKLPNKIRDRLKNNTINFTEYTRRQGNFIYKSFYFRFSSIL